MSIGLEKAREVITTLGAAVTPMDAAAGQTVADHAAGQVADGVHRRVRDRLDESDRLLLGGEFEVRVDRGDVPLELAPELLVVVERADCTDPARDVPALDHLGVALDEMLEPRVTQGLRRKPNVK